jgi:hypothetical protein
MPLKSRPRPPKSSRNLCAVPGEDPTLSAPGVLSLPKLSQDAVDTALEKWLSDTASTGRQSIDISVGALHARVGATQQPPMCCDAMWKVYDKSIDTVLSGPASGYSSGLCIRFKLPRP